jgi:hypothetical protein
MIENIELTKAVARMARDACFELFRAYGLNLRSEDHELEANDQRVLCGVIGFVGSGVRGSCMLVGHDELIMGSCPDGGRSRDWIGELTNQLAGRVKAKLLKYGVEVALSTPIGVSGVAVHPIPRNELKPTYFSALERPLIVWVEMDSDPGFVLAESAAPEPGRTEGEIVLF